ncbi:MAG: putative sensor protein [Actinotalea sp.]|nr:putative sensor protein [Actinotalea sp.]
MGDPGPHAPRPRACSLRIGGSAVSQSPDRRAPAERDFEHRVELDLRVRPMTAAEARRVVRDHLSSWDVDEACVDVVLLLTSELVTNASRHASPPRHLVLRHGDAGVRVEVEDSFPTLDAPRRPDHDEHGGRGLWLVTMLATRWGHHPRNDGKVVWFHLAAAPDMSPPA